MQRSAHQILASSFLALTLAVGISGGTFSPPAWADPPGDRGHGRGQDRDDDEHGKDARRDHEEFREHRFEDHDRVAVRDYFVEHERRGNCPPGLAKKHDGCLPPGQARKWHVGAPLPAGEVTYDLPPELVVQLTPPPVGYRYVRVAQDILMIAAGTGMVAEAIQDLGR
jgi:Ni/Co efflux regulator RcnB